MAPLRKILDPPLSGYVVPAGESKNITDKYVSKHENFRAHHKNTCIYTRRLKEVGAEAKFVRCRHNIPR